MNTMLTTADTLIICLTIVAVVTIWKCLSTLPAFFKDEYRAKYKLLAEEFPKIRKDCEDAIRAQKTWAEAFSDIDRWKKLMDNQVTEAIKDRRECNAKIQSTALEFERIVKRLNDADTKVSDAAKEVLTSIKCVEQARAELAEGIRKLQHGNEKLEAHLLKHEEMEQKSQNQEQETIKQEHK